MINFKTLSPDKALQLKLFFKYDLWHYIFVILCIAICAYIFDKWFESVAFVCAHLMLRYKLKYAYHSRHYCLLVTVFVVFCFIPNVISVNLSLLSSIPIALFVCWIGNKAQESKILKRKNAKLRYENSKLNEKLKPPKPFNVDYCTVDELIERCADKHLSEENTQLALEFFIYKTKQSILADRLCIDEKSVQEKKRRLRQKLNRV